MKGFQKKNIKCVLRLSCVIHGPIYGRFMGCTVNGFLSIYKVNQGWGLQRSGPTDPPKENGRKFAPTAPIASKFLTREWDFLRKIKYWDLRTLNIIGFTFFYKIIFWCEFNVANICNLSRLKSSTEPTSDVNGC